MKTILFLIPTLGGGGAERVLVNLVNNMDKSRYKTTVQTLFDVGINKEYLSGDVEYIAGMKKQFIGYEKRYAQFSPTFLYSKIIKKKYDIVVSYLEGPTARIVSGCCDAQTKLICWIHSEQQTMQFAARSFCSVEEAENCYGKFDKIICVAETVKADIESVFDLNVPTDVLYNINEDAEIRARGNDSVPENLYSNEINVVSVGRLIYEKGYDRLIRVHRKLLDEGMKHHVYILGAGDKLAELQRLATENKVSETFHFLGFVRNPYKYVSKADLFVCSSRKEGFSTAVTEALILGIPVVSTNCSGAKELLGFDNDYGIVTENSEQGIYNGLNKILSDAELLKYYKKQAVIRGKDFSKEKFVRAVEDMFENLY